MKNNLIGNGQQCFGTAVIYAARPDHWIHVQGDYNINLNGNSFPKETQAYRRSAKWQKEKIAQRAEALRDEIVVIFGPEVTSEKAISLLRQLAKQLAKHRLFTGYDNQGRKAFEKPFRQI